MKTNDTAVKTDASRTKLVLTTNRLKQLDVKRERSAKYCLRSS